MSRGDFEERTVNGLRLRIDRLLCVGFGDCVTAASEAFRLDDDGIAAFVTPEAVDPERLRQACEACPVDALTVWDADGTQVVP